MSALVLKFDRSRPPAKPKKLTPEQQDMDRLNRLLTVLMERQPRSIRFLERMAAGVVARIPGGAR